MTYKCAPVYPRFTNLKEFAHDLGLIKRDQFAYGKHSSATVALIGPVDLRELAIDKGEKVVCAFLRKVFDVIHHNVLLQKLAQYGVKESELDWFRSYLSERCPSKNRVCLV